MIDLDAWLDATDPAEGARWTLTQPLDISDTGWVTGNGGYDADGDGPAQAVNRAFLLDASSLTSVPEPAALTMWSSVASYSSRAAGVAVVVARRDRTVPAPM
jgi:hypothetical protein